MLRLGIVHVAELICPCCDQHILVRLQEEEVDPSIMAIVDGVANTVASNTDNIMDIADGRRSGLVYRLTGSTIALLRTRIAHRPRVARRPSTIVRRPAARGVVRGRDDADNVERTTRSRTAGGSSS
jgi:hypothetical protein